MVFPKVLEKKTCVLMQCVVGSDASAGKSRRTEARSSEGEA